MPELSFAFSRLVQNFNDVSVALKITEHINIYIDSGSTDGWVNNCQQTDEGNMEVIFSSKLQAEIGYGTEIY